MHRKLLQTFFYQLSALKSTIIDPKEPVETYQHRYKPNKLKIRLDRISDPLYFMKIINEQHSLEETNRMLRGIVRGVSGLTKNTFEGIFKKYSFYIEKIPISEAYGTANFSEKLNFLENVTEVYMKMGKLKSNHMMKAFNKISDELYASCVEELKKNNEDSGENLGNILTVILSISRYNKLKAVSLFKSVEQKLISQRLLTKIGKETSLKYMELMSNLMIFNRLIVETCIDVLNNELSSLNHDQFLKVTHCLSSSQYPINRSFVLKIVNRIDQEFNKNIDHTSGISHGKNEYSLRNELRILSSISMIESNMNLASAYLPELNKIYDVELNDIGNKYLTKMHDKDLEKYCGFLRRSTYYDETLLKSLVIEVMRRNVKELNRLVKQNDFNEDEKRNERNEISIDTLCAALHTMAIFNYRDANLISYFIKLVNIVLEANTLNIPKMPESQYEGLLEGEFSKTENVTKSLNGLDSFISYKHYSRVIWSLCVLGTKDELAQMYPIFEKFFILQYENQSAPINDMLNFYYCYLLLKTYFPKSTLSFEKLAETLEQKQLTSSISLIHSNFYSSFIDAGIPALKEHNISNLMCDVFVPFYVSQNGQYEVHNVIIDIHGPHHFMRNCDRVKGGGALRRKILESEGYVYEYVGFKEWELVSDKKEFVFMLMDTIAEKRGKGVKAQQQLFSKETQLKLNLPSGSVGHLNEIEEEGTTRIRSDRRKGRKITTNSFSLDKTLNKRKTIE